MRPIQRSIEIFFLILCLSLPLFLSVNVQAGLISGCVNSGGSSNSSDKIKFISLGGISRGYSSIIQKSASIAKTALKQAIGPSAEFILHEAYTFPNPAKSGKKPTLHIEVGVADLVDFRIYDVAGDLIFKGELTSAPQVIGLQYAYEYQLNSDIASGTYICKVQAKKQGKNDITTTIKFAIIR
ncbi:MAG: T9SS type A sorting domain-containing protein [Elusimicrobia bacterium]|nr:T9SS type A sorting domain-containing protein [Candidatus Liberimonas magnetica]